LLTSGRPRVVHDIDSRRNKELDIPEIRKKCVESFVVALTVVGFECAKEESALRIEI
jgi:hypothetical protein